MSPQHLAFAPSLSVFPHLPPKDTAVSGIRPGCGLVLAGQWAMQAFFSPCSGLLSGVFTLRCVLLGPLYPHYWLQVMFWTQSSWPRRRPDTSLSPEDPQETRHTLVLSSEESFGSLLAASSCLAPCQSIRFSHFNQEKINTGHPLQTNRHASAALFPDAPQNLQPVHFFHFAH